MAKSTPATRALDAARIAYGLHSYTYDADAPRIGLHAAESLGINPKRMFKTLMTEIETGRGRQYACALLPADAEMSLKKLAALAKGKQATMLKGAEAEKITGYHIGGISPLGQRKRVPCFADSSLMNHQTVFINGGQRGLQIEINPQALVDILSLTLADLVALP